ncbi:hypothetical protein M8312_04865 [Sphingomonas sp. KRR8]|uniref:hypothetical protein n=1 Tax=Sphingomonas sp. KRR8 TaxID=2942996 RepID=UPI0020203503|nr:hypothetical protein [Sphingomonas sp. KRR8]URD61847.1 hypothetical protein M8312_04865 [Sphingomonas sp. KRR8]
MQLLGSYLFSANACARADDGRMPEVVPSLWLLLLLLNVVCIAAAICGMMLALRSWRKTRHEGRGGGHHLLDVGEGRTRFSALSAAIVSGIFLFAILAEFGALLILQRCAPGYWL